MSTPRRGAKLLAWATLGLVVGALLGTPAFAPGPPSNSGKRPLPPHRAGEILIKFREHASPLQRSNR